MHTNTNACASQPSEMHKWTYHQARQPESDPQDPDEATRPLISPRAPWHI